MMNDKSIDKKTNRNMINDNIMAKKEISIDGKAIIALAEGGVVAPKGFKAAGVTCGIKQSGRKDVAMLVSETPASVAAVFTTNKMAAPPVHLSKKHVAGGKASAIIVNSGNANACTGERGARDAALMSEQTATALGIAFDEVLVASTGIIGELLPMEKIEVGIKKAAGALSDDVSAGIAVAEAIMTTDTFKKEIAVTVEIVQGSGKRFSIGGIAKGSGMIEPNMATMLAFITTDASIDVGLLDKMLKKAVDMSFNAITVDGDTSTNDMVAILANGASGVEIGETGTAGVADISVFQQALDIICIELAKLIVRDGEGATKLIEIEVVGAANDADAKKAAKAIANSNLVKTAFFGQDANWGRIVCAAGYSSAEVDQARIDVFYEDQKLVEDGRPIEFDKQKVDAILKEKDIHVTVDLKLGNGKAKVWTCDFSYDYVKINAEYHT